MTVNLEKALIKANKKILTPEQLLIVKEYEQHAGLVNDDALERVGMNKNIKGGQSISDVKKKLKDETKKFKQERVFHISQIEQTCKDYYLRFLPSVHYSGTIDKELPFKISNFEAAYKVKCQCDWKPSGLNETLWSFATQGKEPYKEPIQNTFIMAPASSFELQEKPKDPLFFYKINDEYYYLIHKWGNDLSVFRRLLGFASSPFNTHITITTFFTALLIWGIVGLSVTDNKAFVALIMTSIFGFTLSFLTLYIDNSSFVRPNKWNSEFK